ncbi:acyltransferase family protein [Kitasatospora kifunensis]
MLSCSVSTTDLTGLEPPGAREARAIAGPSGAESRRPVSLPSLTGLRWTAALMVFFYHVHVVEYFGGRVGDTLNYAFAVGNTGVSFFFILSGFVLAWSSPPGSRGIVKFWRRRFARVYPLHLVTLGFALLMAYCLAAGNKPLERPLLANIFLVQSWVHDENFFQGLNPVSWSLACEAFFYFLFPLLIRPLRALGWRGAAVLALASVVAVLSLPTLVDHYVHPVDAIWAIYYFPLARVPEFLLGIALAELVREGRWRGPGLTVSVGLTLAGYFLSSQADYAYRFTACTLVGFAALIAAAAQADLRGEPSPWRGKLSVKLGEISFAFYMVHILVIRTGETLWRSHPKLPWWPGGLLAAGTAFAVSLALAWALHVCVENPGRKLLLRSWGRKKRAHA